MAPLTSLAAVTRSCLAENEEHLRRVPTLMLSSCSVASAGNWYMRAYQTIRGLQRPWPGFEETLMSREMEHVLNQLGHRS
jgi:hypothetical protein